MRFKSLSVLCLLLPLKALGVQTGPVVPPALAGGQFVYTVPAGFSPPGIGDAGLTEIQNVAAKLKQPFYVVIVQKLPTFTREQEKDAQVKGYTQFGDELLATYAVDRLSEDFAMNHPGAYDLERASVFLLSYEPRQFRVLSGAKWKTDLGLRKERLDPYLSLFRAAVTGSPKNPKGGIISLITAYDAYVFDQTDPERVAARAAAAEKAAREEAERLRVARIAKAKADEVARLNVARGALDAEIATLGGLLKSPVEYLPLEVGNYRELLTKASNVRHADIPEEMLAMSESMKPSVKVLQGIVDKAEHAANMERFQTALFYLFWLLLTGGIAAFLLSRKNRYLELKADFAAEAANWQGMMSHAATQYLGAYEKRDAIVAMSDVTGRTKELWDATTAEVDDIWIGVMALKDHIEAQVKLAATASYFDMTPLENAIRRLTEPFDFDTGQVNKDQLFAPSTKVLRVSPTPFQNSLSERFKKNAAAWQRLQQAADARLTNAAVVFPHTTLTELQARAEKYGIPSKWLSDHPLAGDGDADTSLWEAMDKLKWTDPVFYMEQVLACRKTEQTVKTRIDLLEGAFISLAAAKVTDLKPLGCVLLPQDNPEVTLMEAHAAVKALPSVLDTLSESKDAEAFARVTSQIETLYRKARQQIAAVEAAVLTTGNVTLRAATAYVVASRLLGRTSIRVKDAQKVHAKVGDATAALSAAERTLEKADQSLEKARGYLAENRFVDASRKADHASSTVADVEKLISEAEMICATLDRDRDLFQKRVKGMTTKFEAERSRAARYSGNVGSFKAPTRPAGGFTGSATDYGAALREVVAQEHAWERLATSAQESPEYAEAQRRAAAARERARQEAAERAAEDARRRESYSSYSSSSYSSSSYGGGSDSGGGDSGGGGGSDSGGGGW